MKLSDFDYKLPQELIAQYPAPSRESSRMLVLERNTRKITHADFKDFSAYVKRNDIVVLNDTKVINARLIGRRATGGRVEIFLLETIGDNRFKVLIRPSGRIKESEEITFDNSRLKARLLTKRSTENVVEFSSTSNDIDRELKELGNIPLPPYIRRKTEPLDSERYQTVYAKKEGATAAPTAGLHFTEEILEDMASRGTRLSYVTLHVNYGTFAPVKTEKVVDHKMYSESFEVSMEAASKINDVKAEGGRVFAVGTTSCRVLETCAVKSAGAQEHPSTSLGAGRSTSYKVEARKGKTDLFIYPGYRFKMVDALLTNFHFPKSTLLMLVCAFAGKELVFKAYEEAIERRYRFFSYGDCMLIL